MIKHYNIIRRC